MKEKREALTNILMTLMEQQKKRAAELQKRMDEMEMRKDDEMDNYWLIQYQKLLDSKPKRLVEAEKDLDQVVKDLLIICGGEELIPLFAKKRINMKQLSHMDHKALEEVKLLKYIFSSEPQFLSLLSSLPRSVSAAST